MSKENKSQWQEVKSSTVAWSKIGDFVEGTLSDIQQREVRDDLKGLVKKNIYEIKADAGEYHLTDATTKQVIEPGIKCDVGDIYTVWGGKPGIDAGMRKAKIGQKVKVLFAEQLEPKKKGYSGFKIIKVFLGVMDDEFLADKEPSNEEVGY